MRSCGCTCRKVGFLETEEEAALERIIFEYFVRRCSMDSLQQSIDSAQRKRHVAVRGGDNGLALSH
jgi:hypothetical protein